MTPEAVIRTHTYPANAPTLRRAGGRLRELRHACKPRRGVLPRLRAGAPGLTVDCSRCGAPQPPGAAFCDRCGAGLASPGDDAARAAFCADCGTPQAAGDRFCAGCGAALETWSMVAAPTGPPEPVAPASGDPKSAAPPAPPNDPPQQSAPAGDGAAPSPAPVAAAPAARHALGTRRRISPAILGGTVTGLVVLTLIVVGAVERFSGGDDRPAAANPGPVAPSAADETVPPEDATATDEEVPPEDATATDEVVPSETATRPSAAAPRPTLAAATVRRTCGLGGVGGDCRLSVRARPSSSSGELYRLREGDTVRVRCQVRGDAVFSSVLGRRSSVWSRVSRGGYVTNAYLVGARVSYRYVTLRAC